MFYIEAPDQAYGDLSQKTSIFMAGGITGCPDWQRDMRDLLINTDALYYNPRRADFPIDDPNASEEQITWEREHLQKANAILFWFPCETLCPIALFELGAWSHWREVEKEHNHVYTYRHKPIFVGAHPGYPRRQDVLIQMKGQRPEIEVVDSLPALAAQVSAWIRSVDKR